MLTQILQTLCHIYYQAIAHSFLIMTQYDGGTVIESDQGGASIATLSDGLLGPVGTLAGIMYKISYIIAAGLFVGAIVRYRQHKQNPNRVRFGEVVFYLIFSIILAILPFIVQYSTGAQILDHHSAR